MNHKDEDRIRQDHFLTELDGMIEATEEFIQDDGLRADDSRIGDLAALIRVRELFTEIFQLTDTPTTLDPRD
jgi:hypothetical protein